MPAEVFRTVPLAPILLVLLVYSGVVIAFFRRDAKRSAASAAAVARRSAGDMTEAPLEVPVMQLLIALALPFMILFTLALLRA